MADKKKSASADPKSGAEAGSTDEPIVIKKYANRRLYNTATSSYVTLEYLSGMVRDGEDFVVYDAKTGDDITRSVLTQIIFEQESKGENLLPVAFLRQLISFYGDALQGAVPQYLELSMERFTRDQEKMREHLMSQFGGGMPANPFEDMARQNAAMFERMFQMFTPFGATGGDADAHAAESEPEAGGATDDGSSDDESGSIAALKDQLDALQRQLDDLAKK